MTGVNFDNTKNKVVIVGAGIAGLTAALQLKSQGIPFIILEASTEPGGRAKTVVTEQGNVINKGANWVHGGKKNSLYPFIEKHQLSYTDDTPGESSALAAYYNDEHYGAEFRKKLAKPTIGFSNAGTALGAIRSFVAGTLRLQDSPIQNLGFTRESQEIIRRYQPIWIATDKPEQSSAIEFLHDPGTPGGLQLEGGIQSLIQAMVKEVGEENIRYNFPVKSLATTAYGTKATNDTGEEITGKYALFTGSIGVLKSNRIDFDPPHGKELTQYLDGISMGTLAKIVLEVKPEFFKNRPEFKNMHIDLLDQEPAVFCHLNSNGANTIALLVGGEAGKQVENMTPEQALKFAQERLAMVKEVTGYEEYVQGAPFVTDWSKQPYVEGAYSARNTHGVRKPGLQEGNILYAGEAFDNLSPGTIQGAFRSGEYAGQKIVSLLNKAYAKDQLSHRQASR